MHMTDTKTGFEFDIQGDTLIVHLRGFWDLALASEYAQQFKYHASQMPQSGWYRIIEMSEWDFDSPEVEQEMHLIVVWCLANGCQDYFYVVGDIQNHSQTLQDFVQHLGPQVYETMQQATDHLNRIRHY